MKSATKDSPASAQTVARAIRLLRLIASSQTRNLRLIDIAEMADLDKSTAHRLLNRLVDERMLARDAGERGYRLGPLLYEFGLAALPETNLREISESALRDLAHQTGDMAFLIVRSGYETVCMNRIAGNFEIQTLTRNVGDRHPLGAGAGGLAILAALSDQEIRLIVSAIGPQLPRYHLTEEALWERVRKTRETGRAIDEGCAALDITAIGRVIRNKNSSPIAAVFVASISSRMDPRHQARANQHLITCVSRIETELNRQQLPGATGIGPHPE